MLQDNEIIHDGGYTYRVTIEHDDISDPPWISCEGHGPVTDWTARSKHSCERVLSTSGNLHRFYNIKEAVEIAKRDGWNTEPYVVPGETAAQRAARAVEADFQHLQAYCRDEWDYRVVTVQLVDGRGRDIDDHPNVCTYETVGGNPSDSPESIEGEARSLAAQITENLRNAGLTYTPACWEPI